MIVPIAKSSPGQSTAMADMPSETNMLMALGIMHKNGYFDKSDDSATPKKLRFALPGGEK